MIEDSVGATSLRVEQLFAIVLHYLPPSPLDERNRTVSLNTPSQSIYILLTEVSRGQLHQLQVLDASDVDLVETKQGIGVVANVEEDLDNVPRLQHCLQRATVCASGSESISPECGYVNKIDVPLRLQQDRDQ